MQEKILHLDFETRSAADLKKYGANVYAKHESTEPLVMAFAYGDANVDVWQIGEDPEVFEALYHAVMVLGYQIHAYNAAFEKAIWNYCVTRLFGVKPIPLHKFTCTMARAYAASLPGHLDGASAALGIKEGKMKDGHRIMMQMSKPRDICKKTGKITWWANLEKFNKLVEYCKQDVVVERETAKRIPPLSSAELKVWELDQKINEKGIKIDVKAAEIASEIVVIAQLDLNKEIQRITKGVVGACSETKRLANWIRDEGVETAGVAKNDCEKLIRKYKTPPHVKEAARTRLLAAKTSTAKLVSFIKNAEDDDRARNLFQYHGATTGRWAGRRIQPHNMPRPSLEPHEIERVFDVINSNHSFQDKFEMIWMCFGSPLGIISDCLRGFLIAEEGHELISLDFNAIEARTLAWLACENHIIKMFENDECVYIANAMNIYNLPFEKITKDMRFIGKVAELALGYEGGYRAFRALAKSYGVTHISDSQAKDIVKVWRAKRPGTVESWRQMECAALKAIANPKTAVFAGNEGRQIKFVKNGSFLWCQLPSKRVLCYPYPKIMEVETPWGDLKDSVTYMSTNALTRKWERTSTYGGKIVENINQGIARDNLVYAMQTLDNNNFNIVVHVHDEVVVEETKGLYTVEQVQELVEQKPKWADGLPIKASGWKGKRYRK